MANLVASPDAGYRFIVTGNVTTVANVNAPSTSISLNGSYSIVANFVQIPPGRRALSTSSTDGGSVAAPGERSFVYDEGTVVDLEAEPDEGYRFVRWTGDVDDIANVNGAATIITMNNNYSITATFRPVGGCFIATAAYGTPMADEIQILRDFRDEYLLTNPMGKILVDIDYRISPPIAGFIINHPSLKPIVRGLGIVLLWRHKRCNHQHHPRWKAAILGFLVLISLALTAWAIRRRGRGPEYT